MDVIVCNQIIIYFCNSFSAISYSVQLFKLPSVDGHDRENVIFIKQEQNRTTLKVNLKL